MQELIKDPYFRVEIDYNASSANAAAGIWHGQHVTVAEGFSLDDPLPANPAEAVIRHQLKVKHWSVLNYGFVVLHFGGFPHDCAMQWVRHQDSHFDVENPGQEYPGVFPLCQSMRYTGDRIIAAAEGKISIESVFYTQPAGIYKTRTGSYQVTQQDRLRYFEKAHDSACDYAKHISFEKPEEYARRSLLSGYRQNFTMAGRIKAILHALDQRTLTDSQGEAQTLAWMALEKLKEWQPEFLEFYEKTRAGKNLLAP
jgi:thymidylate synthase ThyX